MNVQQPIRLLYTSPCNRYRNVYINETGCAYFVSLTSEQEGETIRFYSQKWKPLSTELIPDLCRHLVVFVKMFFRILGLRFPMIVTWKKFAFAIAWCEWKP